MISKQQFLALKQAQAGEAKLSKNVRVRIGDHSRRSWYFLIKKGFLVWKSSEEYIWLEITQVGEQALKEYTQALSAGDLRNQEEYNGLYS